MRMTQEVEDDEKGKLFVGGLSWETTQDSLNRYFSRFGEVIDCVVMKNNESGRSRGFGFVTFSDPSNVSHVLQSGPHNLDGRTIDPKPCNPRTLQKPKKGTGYPKVFLGGLPSNVTETELRMIFGRYGKVMEVVIMYDQEKKKSRGFGFLSFEDEASVERVTSEHYVNLNGKQVEIKKAEPRDGSANNKIVNHDGNPWTQQSVVNIGATSGGCTSSATSGHQSQQQQQNTTLGMIQGPNGQTMGAPTHVNVAAMGAPSMLQGYQGWGSSPQQQGTFSYGTPNAPGSFQRWGAPPGGPPPHQWNNYATQQTPGYGSYDLYNLIGPSGASGGAAATNWNTWNISQNSTGSAATNDMYSRPQIGVTTTNASGTGGPPTGVPSNSAAKSNEYGLYATNASYGNYINDQNSTYGSRTAGYVGTDTSQTPYQTSQSQGKGF